RSGIFPALLGGMLLSTVACAPPFEPGEVVRSTGHQLSPYQLTEEVRYEYSSLGDDYYQRVYVLAKEQEEIRSFVGTTTMWSPEADFMNSPPKQVGDWLAVFSLDQVWIWQPGKDTISFKPIRLLENDVWKDAGVDRPEYWSLYGANDFVIESGKWILEYEDLSDAAQPKYYFVSEDQGQTFMPWTEAAPP
ncbi:MAG: hypothetical protein AAFP09_06415, partial [Cyanobacteria bacterium J06607_10]